MTSAHYQIENKDNICLLATNLTSSSNTSLLTPKAMAPTPPTPFHLLLIFLLSILISVSASPTTTTSDSSPPPIPTPWPHQFHSILDTTMSTGNRTIVDLWYDWPNSRNFNIIHYQLGQILYDLEWNNGTSFLYTLDASRKCRTLHFSVGILRPNWLDGANYLGQEMVDGFLCNVWEKVDFIWYYEDVVTKRPVYWRFYTGMSSHVMTFEVGAVLEDAKWQAPVYCFDKMGKGEKEDEEKKSEDFQGAIADGSQNSLRSLTRLMGHYDL